LNKEEILAALIFTALFLVSHACGATPDSKPDWCAATEPKRVVMSADDRLLLVATQSPPTVRIFDHDRKLVRSYPIATRDGKTSSDAYAVYDAIVRKSFLIVLRDLPELWEISYDPRAEPIYDGLVHDYRMGEALGQTGYLGVRRTLLNESVRDLFFDEGYRHAISVNTGRDGKLRANVINLDIRRGIANIELSASPQVEAGSTVHWPGGSVMIAHGPDASYKRSQTTLRRYCAP
jgi:hypothetical protein